MDFDFSKIDGFEWDLGNLGHIRKHRFNYKECEEVFLNQPVLINEDETHSHKEERFRVYGQTSNRRMAVIIITIRNNKIRVISARSQTKKERKEFREIGGEYLSKN